MRCFGKKEHGKDLTCFWEFKAQAQIENSGLLFWCDNIFLKLERRERHTR
jgi:hypothetical protein